VELKSGNLHSYWDSRLGSSETGQFVNQPALTIQSQHPKAGSLDMDPEHWAREDFELRSQVYSFTGDGTEASPALYSDAYAVDARETSYARATLAGYRLAEFLNSRF